MEKEKKKSTWGSRCVVSRALFVPYRPLPSPPPLLLICVDASFVGGIIVVLWL